METQLRDMTGEQLLLLRVLGDGAAQTAVEGERDRRALANSPGSRWRRLGRAMAVAYLGPQLAA
ncbi:hypothetical protein LCGC14_0274610 [marine sediment metagenome]|uniref:Uncharacterized protein n=1 Tax=marine sediment metagenome TaxID=412755 RepID=A0A0F9X2Z3_9ZZZZ|nr:hypothetical protein [Phycisphaerae bacterium]HDZ43399.1 hypothetical protein [Phycisphaerae bacterium]